MVISPYIQLCQLSQPAMLVIAIPWISEQEQPGWDLCRTDAAEQGNATLMLPSCQIVSPLSCLSPILSCPTFILSFFLRLVFWK